MENTKTPKKKFKLDELTKVVKRLPVEEQKKIYYMAKGVELYIEKSGAEADESGKSKVI